MQSCADVRVNSKAALLHTYVAYVSILQNLFQRPQIRTSLCGGTHVGLAYYLDQRNSGAVQVARSHVWIPIVNRLSCVLLHVQTRNRDRVRIRIAWNASMQRSVDRQWLVVLGDLVSFR